MEAFNKMCTDDLCEYNKDTQIIECYDWDNEKYNKVCDVEVYENKRGFYVKIIEGEKHLLLTEVEIEKVKSDDLKMSLLSLLEEAEEMSRRFYEPDADDWHENYKLNN